MLQDLLMPNKNTDELITKNLGSRKEELILMIDDFTKRGFYKKDDASEFKNKMLDLVANIFEKNISNEKELLSFINRVLKELNKEKTIDSGEIALMSFILGAATSIMRAKIHNQSMR